MARLTDDELGELLRETFADRESLVDRLPEAPKRRSPVPALLAAAAVVAVLAGVLYGANRLAPSNRVSPAATSGVTSTTGPSTMPTLRPWTVSTAPLPTFTTGGDVWGAAIVDMVQRFKPEGGGEWVAIQVNGGHPIGVKPAITFSRDVRTRIEQTVTPVVPVRWGGPESPAACLPGRIPIVFLYPIVDRGDHQEVRISMVWGCGARYDKSATYRVEKVGRAWKVTAR